MGPRRPQCLDIGERDGGVVLAEVHHHRHRRVLVGEGRCTTAVVGDSGGEHVGRLDRRTGHEHAPPAEPDDTDLGLAGRARHGGRGGAHIEQRLVVVELAAPGDAPPDLDVRRLVGELDTPLDPVEQRRRDGHVAVRRVAVDHGTDVAVHAEDLLDDHHGAVHSGIARRIGAVGVELEAVGGGECHVLPHARNLLRTDGRRISPGRRDSTSVQRDGRR